ncbi:hypothetical protein ACTMTF_06335 [Nonomuraea sp. ZG12]|uniref:hypothetical protein n=1 Tax=Nonomuraea sp. ZG12 TaxID=3452207 RepID=UPI003F8A82EF
MPSTDPARRRVHVTRYMRHGHGDEFSAHDAMSAARAAMTSVKDMHRTTTFEAGNSRSIAHTEFATTAQAAGECITKVAGLDKVGPQVPAGEHGPACPDDRRPRSPVHRACSRLTRTVPDAPQPQRPAREPIMTTLERTLAKALTEIVIVLDLSEDDAIAEASMRSPEPALALLQDLPEQDRQAPPI